MCKSVSFFFFNIWLLFIIFYMIIIVIICVFFCSVSRFVPEYLQRDDDVS